MPYYSSYEVLIAQPSKLHRALGTLAIPSSTSIVHNAVMLVIEIFQTARLEEHQ